jgi:hypothetical protein
MDSHADLTLNFAVEYDNGDALEGSGEFTEISSSLPSFATTWQDDGTLTLEPSDCNLAADYSITIEGTDSGDTDQTVQCTFILTVDNVNKAPYLPDTSEMEDQEIRVSDSSDLTTTIYIPDPYTDDDSGD